MKKIRLNNPTGGRLALLTAALIWGSSFIIMKDTLDNIPVYQLLAIRFTLASLLLGVIFRKRLMRAGRQIISRIQFAVAKHFRRKTAEDAASGDLQIQPEQHILKRHTVFWADIQSGIHIVFSFLFSFGHRRRCAVSLLSFYHKHEKK